MRVFLTASALENEIISSSYNNWLKSRYETEDEFIERKRGLDLADLVELVINEKLTEKERLATKAFWYQGLNHKDIAEMISTSLPNVYRILNSAENKLRAYLEYVVVYQEKIIRRELIPIAVRQALVDSAEKSLNAKSMGQRIKKLRVNENIPIEKLEASIQLKRGRLKKIEEGRSLPQTEELIKISVFFNSTTDYILFGKKG